MVYSRSGLTYQARLLAQRGLVTRSPSPDDERSTAVAITAATYSPPCSPAIAAVRELLFAPAGDDDAGDLTRILGRVSTRLRATAPRSAARRRKT